MLPIRTHTAHQAPISTITSKRKFKRSKRTVTKKRNPVQKHHTKRRTSKKTKKRKKVKQKAPKW